MKSNALMFQYISNKFNSCSSEAMDNWIEGFTEKKLKMARGVTSVSVNAQVHCTHSPSLWNGK